MALFNVNTGTREGEVCGLKWEYEVEYPHLNTSVFVVPGDEVKNGMDRVVILNKIAMEVIERLRGIDPVCVFTYKGKPVTKINSAALTQ